MTEPRQILDYGLRGQYAHPRISKLAVTAFVVSILSGPLLLTRLVFGVVETAIRRTLGSPTYTTERCTFLLLVVLPTIAAFLLSIGAWAHVSWNDGRLKGTSLAAMD